MKQHGWEFREAAEHIEAVMGSTLPDVPKWRRSDRENRHAMERLWRSSKAVEVDDPVGRYLAQRVGLISFPECLRTASNVRYQSDRPSFHPAMIAMVTGSDGTPSILHRTYLTADGLKASLDAPRRLMPGTVAKGAAIRLAPAGDALGIAETALSASALFRIPCWAAVNAGMLAAWQPPLDVKRVIIFGDNDASYTGQAAAHALAKRLASEGFVVEVQVPAEPESDWNDVHRLRRGRSENFECPERLCA
jgi:putative DNA primase/helicase